MKNILLRLKQTLKRALFQRIGYLDGHLVRVADLTVPDLPTVVSSTAKIVIVSRQHYDEWTERYPIRSKKDLIARAQLEIERRGGLMAFDIGAIGQDKTTVTYYKFAEHPALTQAWLVIPETNLLAMVVARESVFSYHTPHSQRLVYAVATHDNIVSSVAGGAIQSAEHFAHAHGVSASSFVQFSSADFLQHLQKGLLKPYGWFTRSFIQTKVVRNSFGKLHLKPLVAAIAVAFTAYLLTMNGVLNYRLHQHQHAAAALNQEAREVIRNQNEFDNLLNEYEQIKNQLSRDEDNLLIWEVLAPYLGKLFWLVSLNKAENGYYLNIETESATAALQALLDLDQIRDARFQSPVRRSRGRESASIFIELAAPIESNPTKIGEGLQ